MARPLRIEYAGAWYHVFNRGAGRQKIFLDDYDYRLFLDLLKEAFENWNIETHAFSLMPNHYHLCLHTPDEQLSRALRHVGGVYTQRYNRRHKTAGSLFKGRFKARIIEKETYLLELVRYIHLNPVKAKICDLPEAHEWTSHRVYRNCKIKPDWLFIDEVLSYFGKRRSAASRKFDKFVKERIFTEEKEDKLSFKNMPVVLGTEEFKKWIKEKVVDNEKSVDEIPDAKKLIKPNISSQKIINEVQRFYKASNTELIMGGSGRRNDLKAGSMYLIRKLTGASHVEIAKLFKHIKVASVAQQIYRFKIRLAREENLKTEYQTLEKRILSNL